MKPGTHARICQCLHDQSAWASTLRYGMAKPQSIRPTSMRARCDPFRLHFPQGNQEVFSKIVTNIDSQRQSISSALVVADELCFAPPSNTAHSRGTLMTFACN